MRFMMLVKTTENAGPPPKEFMKVMMKSSEEATKAGTLVATGGLTPLAMGTRLRVSGGKLIVTDGPFTEAKEVVASFAELEVKSKEEAVGAGRWLMQMFIDFWPGWEGETEIRQILGPADYPQA
jgi:hypothetical protein